MKRDCIKDALDASSTRSKDPSRRDSDPGRPEHGVRAGDIGTVVERHVVPGASEEGYSVEFFDMGGHTVDMTTLPASAVRQPTAADRPAVRQLSA